MAFSKQYPTEKDVFDIYEKQNYNGDFVNMKKERKLIFGYKDVGVCKRF